MDCVPAHQVGPALAEPQHALEVRGGQQEAVHRAAQVLVGGPQGQPAAALQEFEDHAEDVLQDDVQGMAARQADRPAGSLPPPDPPSAELPLMGGYMLISPLQ